MPTDEEKLLAILEQPEPKSTHLDERYVPDNEDGISEVCAGETVAEEVNLLDALQRTTLQGLLESNMPSPEEIIRDAKNAKHNDEISQQRQEKLARREARRAKNPKRRRRR
jgi:hypothetical protein